MSSYVTDHNKELCCSIINTYLFDKVWNEPSSEYRVNIDPILITQRSVLGSFSVADANILLPETNQAYYVWCIGAQDFNIGLNLTHDTWVSCTDICNSWNTQIQMYTSEGYMFHKSAVYFRYNLSRNVIFIAVEKRMLQKLNVFSSQIPSIDTYLTVYYDSDQVKDMRILSFRSTGSQDQLSEMTSFILSLKEKHHLQVYRNGIEITEHGNYPTLTSGDYFDFIIDENISFTFDVDITFTSENPVFLSEKDKTWKQLIHIPRALNPNNKVITHNTCDFYIRKTEGPVTGLYVHRAAGKRSVSQVTHNDMAMPLFIIDAHRDTLEEQEVYIHGIVRIHEKDNVLIRDASFIDLLYSEQHDDAKIVDILVGNGPKNIPWWRADHLEQSRYIEMLFDTPNIATTDHIDDYVQAIGFYHVIDLICDRIVHVTVTDGFQGSLLFDIPILYIGYTVEPVVYLNGKMIGFDYISSTTDGRMCSITVDPSIYTKPGDTLSVVFYITGDNKIFEYIPESTSQSTDISYHNFAVYVKNTLVNTTPLSGVNTDYFDVYTQLNEGENHYVAIRNEDGTSRITFNPSLIGKTLLIQNNECAYKQSFDLSVFTSEGLDIVIPIESQLHGTTNVAPILNFTNISVYLNGRYLVKNIDYLVNTLTHEDGIAYSELIVQTMDKFVEGVSDRLDVIYHVAEIEDLSSGFVIEDKLKDDTPVNLYFENISAVHVNGYLERDIVYKSVYMEIPTGKYENGHIFEIQTSIPQIVKDFITTYAQNEDFERLKILNAYFYDLRLPDPSIIVLTHKHRIYSIFMNKFLQDVISGRKLITDEPDIYRMREFIRPYEYLQSMDLCFAGVDQRFLDYYPSYTNLSVTPHMKRLLDNFIREFMPANETPTVEVVYEEQP